MIKSNCQDYTGWKDKLGDTCYEYGLHPDWCTQPTAVDPTTGIDATTACCACSDQPLGPTIETKPQKAANLPCPIGQVWGDLSEKDGSLEVGTAQCPEGQDCVFNQYSWMFGPQQTTQRGVGQRAGCWIETQQEAKQKNRADKFVCSDDTWCKNVKDGKAQCPTATCSVGGKCSCGGECMNDSKTGRCVNKLEFKGVGNNYEGATSDCRLVRFPNGVSCLDSSYNNCDPSFCGIADFELKGTGDAVNAGNKKINVYTQKEYFGHTSDEEQSLVIILGVTLGLLILFIIIIALMVSKGGTKGKTRGRSKGRRGFG